MKYEDGQFIGEVALNAIANATEHFKDDARLLVVLIVLVIEDEAGVHIAYTHQEQDESE